LDSEDASPPPFDSLEGGFGFPCVCHAFSDSGRKERFSRDSVVVAALASSSAVILFFFIRLSSRSSSF